MRSPTTPSPAGVQAQHHLLGKPALSGVGAGAHGYLEKYANADESDLQIYMNRVEGGAFPRVFEEKQSDIDELVCTIIGAAPY